MYKEALSAAHQSLSSIRLLKIMECLSEKHFPVRLTDLAGELDMTQPTVLRYLSALCTSGYAYQDQSSGNYALTWKICDIGTRLQSNTNLRNIVSPYINQMANTLNVGMLLATEKDGNILYLDIALNPGNSMETLLRIGKDAPIHTTASGKIMLSGLTEAELDKIIQEKGLPRLTQYTITNKVLLLEELQKIRMRGYAMDNEECEIGHRCLSVPLRDYTGKIAAAISAFDNTENLNNFRIEKQLIPALQDLSDQVSLILGHQKLIRKE